MPSIIQEQSRVKGKDQTTIYLNYSQIHRGPKTAKPVHVLYKEDICIYVLILMSLYLQIFRICIALDEVSKGAKIRNR